MSWWKTMLVFGVLTLAALPAGAQSYADVLRGAEELRSEAATGVGSAQELEQQLSAQIQALFDAWVGTTWGLGRPQTSTPHVGKINCGTFVGTVLAHAGFEVDIKKLQRQPSELIVKSLAPKKTIRRYRRVPLAEFVGDVRAMGDGVYVVGLDYHVGFIRVHDGEVRFVHADYYSGLVVDEPAMESPGLLHTNYRVVGKILQPELVERWRRGQRIEVLGNW